MEAAYRELRPRLLFFVAKHTRGGKSLPIIESTDLVHDFFLENWTKIQQHYDPSRGELGAYVYRAFSNFVNARLPHYTRQRFLTNSLSDLQNENLKISDSLLTNPHIHDIERLQHALNSIPDVPRKLLVFYFSASPPSFRKVAKHYKVSRYEAEKSVIKALMELLIHFEKPDSIALPDWQASRTLVAVNYSIDQAAHQLGIANGQVRRAHARTLNTISELLR